MNKQNLQWTFQTAYRYPKEYDTFAIETAGPYAEAKAQAREILDHVVDDGELGDRKDWWLETQGVSLV